jgi:hypothetical protein
VRVQALLLEREPLRVQEPLPYHHMILPGRLLSDRRMILLDPMRRRWKSWLRWPMRAGFVTNHSPELQHQRRGPLSS